MGGSPASREANLGERQPPCGVDLNPSAVHLRSAVCLLGRYPALAGVDLDVAEGEVVLVAGPNGAGKTTLLRLLAGLLPLSAGTAIVLGHDEALDFMRELLDENQPRTPGVTTSTTSRLTIPFASFGSSSCSHTATRYPARIILGR